MQDQFLGKKRKVRKLTRMEDILETAKIGAKVGANMTMIPQTVWLTNDKDAPYMSLANDHEFKPELKPRPVVTLLPERYFD